MNPVFVILVFLGLILLWFLLSPLFVPIGKVLYRLYKEAEDEMNRGNIDNEKEKE